MSTKNIFAWTLSGLVVIITIMALLGIWDIIDWSYLKQYFGKAFQSFIIIVVGGVVIYIIHALFGTGQPKQQQPQPQHKINVD
ncbi:MAG: hypothetical protein ACKVOR_06570 [Flavobacteriales bacterium]